VLLGEISLSLYLLPPIALRLAPITPGLPDFAFRIIAAIFLSIALALDATTIKQAPTIKKGIRRCPFVC